MITTVIAMAESVCFDCPIISPSPFFGNASFFLQQGKGCANMERYTEVADFA
jgi:hypothetical protein